MRYAGRCFDGRSGQCSTIRGGLSAIQDFVGKFSDQRSFEGSAKCHQKRIRRTNSQLIRFDGSGTSVQVGDLTHSDRNCVVFVRIAVCAALLANALFARSLHLCQHTAEAAMDAQQVGPSQECGQRARCNHHSHTCGRSEIVPVPGRPTHSRCHNSHSPGSEDQHDHDVCAVCYVIGLTATSPEVASIVPRSDAVFGRAPVLSESASTVFRRDCDARGPPTATQS